MTEWHKPEVTEQEVGLEVTSYLPAELDRLICIHFGVLVLTAAGSIGRRSHFWGRL